MICHNFTHLLLCVCILSFSHNIDNKLLIQLIKLVMKPRLYSFICFTFYVIHNHKFVLKISVFSFLEMLAKLISNDIAL